MISGAGNSALDWANDLSGYAKSVTLIYRKADIKGYEAMKNILDGLSVEKLPNTYLSINRRRYPVAYRTSDIGKY